MAPSSPVPRKPRASPEAALTLEMVNGPWAWWSLEDAVGRHSYQGHQRGAPATRPTPLGHPGESIFVFWDNMIKKQNSLLMMNSLQFKLTWTGPLNGNNPDFVNTSLLQQPAFYVSPVHVQPPKHSITIMLWAGSHITVPPVLCENMNHSMIR